MQLTVYNYHGGPCYRCLFPTPPPSTSCQRCADSGVLGVGKSINFFEKSRQYFVGSVLISTVLNEDEAETMS